MPDQFQAFNNDYITVAAIVMYAIEFVADKIPYFDSLWDAIHIAIRPAEQRPTTACDASYGLTSWMSNRESPSMVIARPPSEFSG